MVTCNVEVSHCCSRTELGSVGVLSTLKTKPTLYPRDGLWPLTVTTEMPAQSLLCVLLCLKVMFLWQEMKVLLKCNLFELNREVGNLLKQF